MRTACVVFVVFCLGALAGCQVASDDGTSHEVASVAVLVDHPQKGVLPRTVMAWGEASQGAPYQQTITLPFDIRVSALNVAAGDAVRKGEILASVDLAPGAMASLATAKARARTAASSLERMRRLRVDSLANDEQVEQAVNALADAQAALAVFSRAGAARGSVAIRAPADGTVAFIAAAPGQVVPANAPVIATSPATRLAIVGGVEPGVATLVHAGMPVSLKRVEGTETMTGHVLGIADAIDGQTHLAPVRIRPDTAPMPGSTWRAEITVGQASGWVAPVDAVVDDAKGTCVYQVHEGKAHRVDVRVVLEREDHVLLEGDIDPTASLVTVGAPQLAEGTTVVANGASR